MDLKILLRYQISGSIFIGWFLLFHYSVHSADYAEMATKIMDISSLASLVLAIPLGAIIHQFSVTIKNQVFGLCTASYLSDSPLKSPTKDILEFYNKKINGDAEKEYLNYIKEKITNLNSFYYLRFDNGFLAPLLAIILFCFVDYQYIPWEPVSLIVLFVISLFIYFIVYKNGKKWECKKCNICKILGAIILLVVFCLTFFWVKSCAITTVNKSDIELTTKSIHVESNIRYFITKEYSFESSETAEKVSTTITDNISKPESLASIIKEDNLQKISIIESMANTSNKINVTCISKCARCSHELSCTIISNSPEDKEESKLHISKTEMTKIDQKLLNNILIVCLIISFLLLSYIPRIIQELKEYTEKLREIQASKKRCSYKCR